MTTKIEVEQIEYHRNGVSGEGFHVVKFLDLGNAPAPIPMLAIVFGLAEDDTDWKGQPLKLNGRVAVFRLDLLATGNINFGENSWRGDHYEAQLRQAIDAEWEKRYPKTGVPA